MSEDDKVGLGRFIAGLVANSTINRYQSGWAQWKQYVQSTSNGTETSDPYLLRAKNDRERACRLGLFLKERYEVKGLRDRAAAAVVAHIQYHFSVALYPTEFFDLQIVTGVRKACRLSTEEIKIKKMNSNATVKLPICEDILYMILSISLRTLQTSVYQHCGMDVVSYSRSISLIVRTSQTSVCQHCGMDMVSCSRSISLIVR